jgi:hypothetical protein
VRGGLGRRIGHFWLVPIAHGLIIARRPVAVR